MVKENYDIVILVDTKDGLVGNIYIYVDLSIKSARKFGESRSHEVV